MSDKMREAFEAWMRVDNTLPLDKGDHDYADFTTSLMWHVWQAAQKEIAEKPSRTSDSGCQHEFVLDQSSSIKICLHCGRSNIGLSKRTAPPALAVPEGWKLVPVEPTYVMVQAGAKLVKNNFPVHTGTLDIYNAMLAAAPEVPRG